LAINALTAGSAGASTVLAADSPSTTAPATGSTTPRPLPKAVTDAIKGLVDNKTITQDQADAVTKAIQGAQPAGGRHGKGGFGHDGPGGPRGFMGPRLDAAAKALGLTTTDLQTELQGGKSIADVAKAHNVDVTTVISALVADAKTNLDQQVKDGKITQAQEDTRVSTLTDRITKMVNNTMPAGRGFGHRGGPFGGGNDAPPAADGSTPTPSNIPTSA
jgi:hypothetical protein